MFLYGGSKPPPYSRTKVPSTAKTKDKNLYPLFLLHMQAQKKKLSKRKRRVEISRSAERDKSYALLMAPPFEKGGRKLYLG